MKPTNYRIMFWILGAILIPSILIFIYNIFFAEKNDGSKYVQEYINNSTEINLVIPSFQEVDTKIGHIRTGLRLKGSGLVGYDKDMFYESNYGKYFSVNRTRPSKDYTYYGLISHILHDIEIIAIVNKSELNDPSYGTKNNPIPIFKFTISNEELEKHSTIPESTYNKCVISDEDYKKSIYYYLSFIMPKDEFKQRFTN